MSTLRSFPALALRNLVSELPGRIGIAVSFEAQRREVTALLGLPGSGKTATLRAISGLDPVSGGSVSVEGVDVSSRGPHLRSIGVVSEGLGLVPELTVADNLRFGLHAARRPVAEREIRLAGLLHTIELGERGRQRVSELTHIEQVSVAIARAMTTEPAVLLLDDPLGPLQHREREQGRLALRALLERLPVTVLLATTDASDVAALAQDCVVLEHGTVVQAGSAASVLSSPATVGAAALAGYEVLIQGRPEAERVSELGVGSVSVPPDVPRDALVQFMAHPAAVLASPRGHGLGFGAGGTVVHSRPLGPLWLVEVALGSRATLLARWEWDPEPPSVGSTVDLSPTGGARMYVGGRLQVAAAPAATAVLRSDPAPVSLSGTG
jgi:ABC-type Fe3+/spermidine/putrescine transport system ATPase subunit